MVLLGIFIENGWDYDCFIVLWVFIFIECIIFIFNLCLLDFVFLIGEYIWGISNFYLLIKLILFDNINFLDFVEGNVLFDEVCKE